MDITFEYFSQGNKVITTIVIKPLDDRTYFVWSPPPSFEELVRGMFKVRYMFATPSPIWFLLASSPLTDRMVYLLPSVLAAVATA